MLAHLSPDAAVLLFTAGVALIALELNRPGWIVPGALGLTAVLTAVASLSHQQLAPTGVALALAGLLVLLVGFRKTLPLPAAAIAAGALVMGAFRLLSPGESPPLHSAVSIPCAVVLGVGMIWLARIARRARRAKGLD